VKRNILLSFALLGGGLASARHALDPPLAKAQPNEQRTLALRVGEQTSISAQGVKSYSEGVPGIVDLRLPKDGGQFVLLALKPGVTTLLLFMLDGRELSYRIEVSPEAEENAAIVVAPEDNVRLDFYFVQVSEGYGHTLGIAWPDSLGGTVSLNTHLDMKTGGLTDASLGIAEQVLPRLDLAQRTGFARVSRQAAVIAENGKQAQFHSGGELNVPIQGALTAEVRSIQFGSDVKVEPRFDHASGRIELHVAAEMADLSDDGGTGIPGRNVAKLDTVVNLDLGKSLVLAGLDASSDARSTRGLPGLSQIPILGGLFGSHSRRSERTKNLLFIVPTVVQAVPLRERNLVEEMLHMYESFAGDVKDVKLLERVPKGAPR
jgi:Flp pilus assembly secretin CpaC